ncbi:GNAT family N-acetyltransferase [Cellulomonas hominis]|uniref:GNAT family N-acetyltransferase n=1 Tax=Cellulomonas hominis TaxID=156981 RepID=UPI001BA42EF2|nr:GNAT family N-acetyltransferase [Cellulomonas hominis]VTR75855.1 Putative phosphinothricin acetyltransferase YwnH [Cellulomonas hominis]
MTTTARTVRVVPMSAGHASDVLAVYAAGIATGHATFESEAPTWERFDTGHLRAHRLVALDDDGTLLGWAAVSPVSARAVYAGVVEASLYVSSGARGRGVGRVLMDALLASAVRGGIWTVQSVVFPENGPSLALHAAAGFRVVGTRERLARMTHGPLAGRWRDVVLLEKRLEPDAPA